MNEIFTTREMTVVTENGETSLETYVPPAPVVLPYTINEYNTRNNAEVMARILGEKVLDEDDLFDYEATIVNISRPGDSGRIGQGSRLYSYLIEENSDTLIHDKSFQSRPVGLEEILLAIRTGILTVDNRIEDISYIEMNIPGRHDTLKKSYVTYEANDELYFTDGENIWKSPLTPHDEPELIVEAPKPPTEKSEEMLTRIQQMRDAIRDEERRGTR